MNLDRAVNKHTVFSVTMIRAQLLCCISIILGTAAACSQYGSDRLREAEQLTREGKYEEAIAAYRTHMDSRLAIQNRPEWENPYFYLVLIGDVYLGKGDVVNALSSYEEAEKNGVHQSLISDRYRSVAGWYEENNELQKAFDILTKYRSRDTLLFDSMLDRIARAMSL